MSTIDHNLTIGKVLPPREHTLSGRAIVENVEDTKENKALRSEVFESGVGREDPQRGNLRAKRSRAWVGLLTAAAEVAACGRSGTAPMTHCCFIAQESSTIGLFGQIRKGHVGVGRVSELFLPQRRGCGKSVG